MRSIQCLVSLAVLLFVATTSHAAMIINMYEQGGNVVVQGSGPLDTSSLALFGVGTAQTLISPTDAYLGTSGLFGDAVLVFSGITGPVSFGLGALAVPDSFVSNYAFSLDGSNSLLGIDVAYIPGESITFSQTYLLQTLADLGATIGTYTWSWAGDSVTLNVSEAGPSSVPEPSTIVLFGAGLAGLAARYRRRKSEEIA